MSEHIVIPARFHGPPDSANGGYACGKVAAFLPAGMKQVTLRHPPPLDTRLRVDRTGPESVVVHHGDVVIAEAAVVTTTVEPPPMVGVAEAAAATEGYRGFTPGNTFMSCFVCGPEHPDGLRLFTGPIPGTAPGTAPVAALWRPDPSVQDESGTVVPEVVWAALDCPTFFASTEPGTMALLGRLTGELRRPVRGGEPYVVVATPTGADGRKRFGTSALYTADGELCALAAAIWFTIEPA